MERTRILGLIGIELNTFNREFETWGFRPWIEENLDLILRKADALGDLHKMNGSYYGTIQWLHYEPMEKDILRRIALPFEEWDEMGRPRKIQETRTYEPLENDVEKQISP